jgi:putative hydrolase of the HAD superfamily
MDYPYLLLDAGGTVLFPDPDLIAQTAAGEGSILDPERVYEAHFQLLHQFDSYLRADSALPPYTLRGFFTNLMITAGAPEDAAERAVDKLLVRHEAISLWTYTKPWVLETLAALKAGGMRMSVISNSDGRVRKHLEDCGIASFFEAIFDSHLVGVEKPDARLFLHALSELGLKAEEALYVGDFYYFDVLGANGAGIGAVHLDPLGLYKDWPGVHLHDIRDLPNFIGNLRSDPTRFDLFPVAP